MFIGTVSNQIPFAATNGAGLVYPFPYCQDTITGNRDWNDTSWKVGLSYEVTDDSMTYLTVNRGFKAGGFFAAGDHADVGSSFEPETLEAKLGKVHRVDTPNGGGPQPMMEMQMMRAADQGGGEDTWSAGQITVRASVRAEFELR